MKGVSETVVYIVLIVVALALIILFIMLTGNYSKLRLDEFLRKLASLRRLG